MKLWPPTWMGDPRYLAQVAHFFGALSVVLLATLFGHHSRTVLEVVVAVGVPLAALKEYWFDIRFEPDSYKGSTIDFTFYMLGAASGVATFFLTL